MMTPNPPEIDDLLTRYRGGRLPPLDYLVKPSILFTIYEGYTKGHHIPMAIFWPEGAPLQLSSWTLKGINDSGLHGEFCKACRRFERAGKYPLRDGCLASDAQHAFDAAEAGHTIKYVCQNGMLDIATPVVIQGRVVAVLMTGQLRPKEGPIWDTTDIGDIPDRARNVDLWRFCQSRIKELQATVGQAHDLTALVMKHQEVDPDKFEAYVRDLEGARDILLELATARIQVDMARITEHFRGLLFEFPIGSGDFWGFIGKEWISRWRLPDEAMVIAFSRKRDDPKVRVEFTVGVPEIKPGSYEIADRTIGAKLVELAREKKPSSPIRLRGFLKDCPIPRESLILVPLGGHGFFAYGYRGTSGGPDIPQTHLSVMAGFGRDIGLLLDDIEASQAKEDFLTHFSHELRSPITTANKIIERIRDGRFNANPTALSEKCRILQALLARLAKLVDGLWHIQKILAKRATYQLMPRKVYDKLAFYASQAQEMSDRTDVKVVVDRKSIDDMPSVRFDEHGFELVVFNLLDNALKYSSHGTEIRIFGRREGNMIVLTFTNVGIRVPPPEECDVFARFVRTKEAESLAPSSAGLGLFLVKHIVVEGHNGKVAVSCEPHGPYDYFVKFEVRLPL